MVGGQGTQALWLKQARELGYKGTMLGSNAGDPRTYCEVAGNAAVESFLNNEPVYSDDIWPQTTQDLYAQWERLMGEGAQMGLCNYLGYGCITFYKQAIEAAGSIDPDEVMKVMDDPNFTYEWFGLQNQKLGGIERYGIRRVHYGYISLSTVGPNCEKIPISRKECPCP
jgi:ABC-type branched-subunit amino acid transport system substrate-binding protein